ncbi:MAG: insulinase family protein [Termitinemataceae bacterium]|nr:MAG: insulinase family protein [Termitinemataceae bacterium]
MQTNLKEQTLLKEGMVLSSGFKILDIVPLQEIKAIGIYAIHEKTLCEVFHVLNDDEENLFAFSFATGTNGSSGVAHIIEHSVLCGSENYPLHDVFTVMCRGSLNTYLNAWTFPDKTVYPASSTHRQDYFNLMSVYGDCVFRPILDEWTFMQEGHRIECKTEKDDLIFTGVVYNEMKGAYSALDEYAQQWAVRSVLSDTIYAGDSGGDPCEITNLTYDEYKSFYSEKYNPCNCKIFLSGNISTEEQLDFLNKNFLSTLSAGTKAEAVKTSAAWKEPKTYIVDAPGHSGKEKGEVFLSWALGCDFDITAFLILEEILLGHDGSPLSRLLSETNLGEDLSNVCGSETELRENIFSVGLRGVKTQNLKRHQIEKLSAEISSLILGELKRLAAEGIPKKEIEAALFGVEVSLREIKRAGGPWSLIYLRRSLRGWIHGAKPWETLLIENLFNNVKKEYEKDNKYFEKIIEKFLLNNQHRALVTVRPEKSFLKNKEEEQAKKLKDFENSLSAEKRNALIEKNLELEKRQNREESPEVLKLVPHIKRCELIPEIEKIERKVTDVAGIPVVSQNIFTNGITYIQVAFPIDCFCGEELLLLPFFTDCIASVGIDGIVWSELSTLLACNTAGFDVTLFSAETTLHRSNIIQTPSGALDLSGRTYMIFRIKTLDAKIEESLELCNRIIRHSDFSDLKRLSYLLTERKNGIDAQLAPNGNTYAAMASNRNLHAASTLQEIWNGITQINFVHKIIKTNIKELSKKLISMQQKLLSQCGIIVNITRENDSEIFNLVEKHFSDLGAVRQRDAPIIELQNAIDPYVQKLISVSKTELFSSNTLQVGFAAVSLSAQDYCTKQSAAETVLCHYLSTGPLWKAIRSKGGAYGANAHSDSRLNICNFTTYRDPNPSLSLKTIPEVLAGISSTALDEDTMDNTIIGTYAKIKRLTTPAQKGLMDFTRFLSNIYDDDRKQNLENVLSVSAQDVKDAAARISKGCAESFNVGIGSKSQLQGASKEAGIKIKALPF